MDEDRDYDVQTIEFKLPEGVRVTGQYLGGFQSDQNIKAIETPDGLNVINVTMRNSRLLFGNPNDVDFSFDLMVIVGGSKKKLAQFRYNSHDKFVYVNDNWVVTDESVENRLVNRNNPAQAVQPIVQNDCILEIYLNQMDFDRLAGTLISTMIAMRFNGGPWLQIGFKRHQLVFIAKVDFK